MPTNDAASFLERSLREQGLDDTAIATIKGTRGTRPETPRLVSGKEQLQADVGEGVDITTGGPAAARAKLSFQTEGNIPKFLDSEFGEGRWRQTEQGNIVITTGDKENQKEVLLDEYGITWKDFADAASTLPQMGGALAATVAALSASPEVAVSIPVLAFAAAAGGFVSASTADALMQSGIDPGVIKDIMGRRGPEALVDFLLGYGGGKVAQTVKGRVAMREEGAPTPQGVENAVSRIEQETGVKIPISVGEKTGLPSLQRIESIGEKLPLSSEIFRKQVVERDLAVSEVQESLLRTERQITRDGVVRTGGRVVPGQDSATKGSLGSKYGKELADDLSQKRDIAEQELRTARAKINRHLQNRLDAYGDSMSPSGRGVTHTEAGEAFRARAELKREAFRKKATSDWEALRELPSGEMMDEPLVNPSPIIEAAKRIEKEVPPERVITEIDQIIPPPAGTTLDTLPLKDEVVKATVESQRPARAFIPSSVKQYLDSIQNLDMMTIDQAKKGRSLIANAIDDGEAMPGVDTGFLKLLEKRFTVALENATNDLPDGELKTGLKAFNKYYQDNRNKFLEPGIVQAFKVDTKAGYVEDSKLVSQSMKSPERLERIRNFLGPDSKEWGLFRRSVYNEMLDNSSDINLPGKIDSKKLATQFSRLNEKARSILFGKDAQDIEKSIRLLNVNNGKIDIANISDLRGGLANQIKAAVVKERENAAVWNNRILKPFLKNEIGLTQMNTDDFVQYGMREGNLDDIGLLFRKLGENNPSRDKFERAVIEDVLNKGTVPATAEDVVLGHTKEGDKIIKGSALFEALKSHYGNDTAKKLEIVLGKKRYQLLKDLATVQSSKEQKAKSAAGGLISGFVVSSIARGNFSAIPMIAQYRVMSWILTNPQFVSMLGSYRMPIGFTDRLSNKAKGVVVLSSEQINDLMDWVGPNDSARVLDALGIRKPEQTKVDREDASRYLELYLNSQGRTTEPDIRLKAGNQQ